MIVSGAQTQGVKIVLSSLMICNNIHVYIIIEHKYIMHKHMRKHRQRR